MKLKSNASDIHVIVNTIDPVPVSQTINVLSPVINVHILLTACHIFLILPVEKI